MKHEKTFEAINKLKDIEIELHRLKNALEMANKALDSQRTWVGLTNEEIIDLIHPLVIADMPDQVTDYQIVKAIEAKLKEKNS